MVSSASSVFSLQYDLRQVIILQRKGIPQQPLSLKLNFKLNNMDLEDFTILYEHVIKDVLYIV